MSLAVARSVRRLLEHSTPGLNCVQQRPASLKVLIVALTLLVSLAVIIGIFAARSYTGTAFRIQQGVQHLTMDHMFNGTFSAHKKDIHWVPEGAYMRLDSCEYILRILPYSRRWCICRPSWFLHIPC